MFQRATKKQAKLRLALEGPAGYGKTYSALAIGRALVGPEGKIAFLDTEAGSASKYADEFEFDVVEYDPPFHPDRAVEAISQAEAAGYDLVIADSLSHFWTGAGGMLEVVAEIARKKYRGDTHRAWKDAGEIQQRLTDSILRSRLHVIAAMRTKKDYVRETVEENGQTKTKIRAAGTKTVQRDEFDYEFDIIGRFDTPTMLAIVKSRCAAIPPETVYEKPGADLAEKLAAWLDSGEPTEQTDEQKARFDDAVLSAGLDRAAIDDMAARRYGRTTASLTAADFEKVVRWAEGEAEKAEAARDEADAAAEKTTADSE